MHKLMIPGTNHSMYVNQKDQKGSSLIRNKGITQARIVKFWRRAAAKLQPTLIIDAGVNYGEIILSAAYPANTDITVIEANEELRPCLSRSLSEHPNNSQFRQIFAFVSDEAEPSKIFYVDQLRSGNSSAYHLGTRASHTKFVQSLTIDSLYPERDYKGDVVLFKLDVEGYEWNALRGMDRMLTQCRNAAGCIEFNIAYLESKGIDLHAFLRFLHDRFLIYAPDHDGKLTEILPPLYDNVIAYFKSDSKCNDLVLLSDSSLYEKLYASAGL